ncbi:Holliday junction branch migration protein RuvA [Candidatus Kuenenbacteria bacterium CG_4_9_14_3_um_filter_39_14]|uniref:Holliday junction branch migration complex subunit RuvA n=5 Tax=Candidatus Kueneniibacteriota TaxID=1752740 RepID=A0A2M7IM33_9BACT|nr:MAG: Holliday junction branch migration protein RuvA [Candidatus Kuenenbacteria bacterium CG10_big_fil_rev_8_21_14_0_10_39_14]PIW95787.1 MAG: Holliday junction branch migration protein RuvA [Candidatus Kuenenbacteria bacterium CG_4_8_14_3_um_filter_39_15]PIX92522.1 MAG: Holliday junction branch migration protein RuvA [Candidatus Kuenenbacteria bacterium CG_4_10_14_3_um_filter_39_14]PJA92261.1 MAG: Holliday junction branch migration protein RuvA [Candidatus Kuenenbacteria bacterium CG_4_9_14_3
MITYLKGTILAKQPKFIILLVNNIGYKIFVLQAFLKKIKLNQELELYAHLRHTEDNMSLFGFASQEELRFFELLLTISGVGPKSALGILEAAKLTDVKKAVLRDDPSILYKVSGIGKKTAERIVVELKNKLDLFPATEKQIALDDSDSEVFDALVSLGYADTDIRQALKQLPADTAGVEAKIKSALKFLRK